MSFMKYYWRGNQITLLGAQINHLKKYFSRKFLPTFLGSVLSYKHVSPRCHQLCLNTFEMFTLTKYLQEVFKLRFQLLHHGFCFVEASASLPHFKLLQEINQSITIIITWNLFLLQRFENNPVINVMLLYSSVTFVLERCSLEVMWVCTEDADVDTKTLQAAQWNISIFVMWSFSCRADKTKIRLYLGFRCLEEKIL